MDEPCKFTIYSLKGIKMRLLTLWIALMFCVSALFIGCDRGMEQPIKEVVATPQTFIGRARAAMQRVNQKRTEIQQKAEKTGDFSIVFTASEDIFKEELGFRKELWVDLVEIYRQEHFEDTELLEGLENLQDAFVEKLEDGTLGMFYFEYIRSFDPLIIEYLRLSFVYPKISEEKLLARFRKSIIDRKVVIIFP